MIVDLAADVQAAVAEAGQAGTLQGRDAALAEVQRKLETARRTLTAFAVVRARWSETLDAGERAVVRQRATALGDLLTPLRGVDDEQLVRYGMNVGEQERGRLAQIDRATQNLRAALCLAQDGLMQRWAETIWSQDDIGRLESLGALPAQQEARAAATVRSDLVENVGADRPLADDELQRLQARVEEARRAASTVRDRPIPADVLAFFETAGTPDGAELSAVTPSVLAWLTEHDAAGGFRVRRA
jgi:hypothetical protein